MFLYKKENSKTYLCNKHFFSKRIPLMLMHNQHLRLKLLLTILKANLLCLSLSTIRLSRLLFLFDVSDTASLNNPIGNNLVGLNYFNCNNNYFQGIGFLNTLIK